MLSTNFFAVVTLLLAKTRAYYIPSNSYVIPVAETPQYLYTPSEQAEELSGYSYVTSDLNGARSNVIFTTGPEAASLFRNQASSISKLIDSMAPGSSFPRPIDTKIPGSSAPRPIDTKIPGSSAPSPIDTKIPGSSVPKPIDTNIPESLNPKPIDTRIPGSPIQNPIETMQPGSTIPKPIGTVIPGSLIQRENVNQAQISYQQFPLFQPHASLFPHNLAQALAATVYNRHYSSPLTAYDHNVQPYVYNPYIYLHNALQPAPAHYQHSFAHLFYPQTVSSTSDLGKGRYNENNDSNSTEEENVQENGRITSHTIDSEVIADQPSASEHSENMTEETTVMSINENKTLNTTEESVGTDDKETKSEVKSPSVSMEQTIDTASTTSKNDM